MSEETVREGIEGDPSLDNDAHDDAQKGAAIGGIGGAVTGALAGSMAGPIGTLAGAVIGGIVGAVTSKAAVGAIDKIEHENAALAHATNQPVSTAPDGTSPASISDPATDSTVLQFPLPEGASTSAHATDDTPDADAAPDKNP